MAMLSITVGGVSRGWVEGQNHIQVFHILGVISRVAAGLLAETPQLLLHSTIEEYSTTWLVLQYCVSRELRMQRFYLTFLHKTSFLLQMVQKITQFEFFRIKIQKSLWYLYNGTLEILQRFLDFYLKNSYSVTFWTIWTKKSFYVKNVR